MKSLLVLAMSLNAAALSAEPIKFESSETPANLVELFTSEGCSSCPPAEAWLGGLKDSPDLWKRIVPVAFHVDYWDGLGWTDRFAKPENTARQRAYAAAWRSDSVYTPGFVVNGQEWADWFRHPAPPEPSSAKVGKLKVTVGNNTAEVVFVPTASAPKSLRVELALLGGNLESDVTRGENSGHKLRHDFTVLCLLAAPLRNVNGEFAAKVLLPAKVGDVPVALAAWVKPDDAQVPIQATGGWLTAR